MGVSVLSGFGVRQFHIGSCLMAALAGGLLISLPVLSAQAQQQVRRNKRRGASVRLQRAAPMQSQTPTPAPARPNRAVGAFPGGGARIKMQGNIDPTALQMLGKMFRPGVNYEGVEVSNASMNGSASEEMITGDTTGRTRREYLSPETIRGDVVLTLPNQSYQFHNRDRQLFAAHWPVEQGDKNARLRAMAKTGRVRIQVTGEEMVAGRSANIVTVTALTGATDEARKVVYLDKETGILLRMDRYDSAGRQISSTYMKNIAVGTTPDATKFDPRLLPPATTFPLFPQEQPMFTSVEQARSQVPFTVREPKQLPPGYILDGVWVFAQNLRANRASVLLRYSSGVNHFSLFETLAPANAAKPARPGQMRPRRVPGGWAWRETVPEGDLTLLYTGHLPETDLQTLQSSMR